MKKRPYLLSVLFSAALTAVLLGCLIARLVYPLVILPRWDVPNLVGLSAAVLVLEGYLSGKNRRNYVAVFLFAAASSGVLPWAVGFVVPGEMGKYALTGGAVFCATSWLYDSLTDRLSTGPAAKAAPVLGGVGLYLAAQCFQSIGL